MPISSKTVTGVSVTLTGEEINDRPTVAVELTHPTLGLVKFSSSAYGARQRQQGIIGHWKGQNILITVGRADFEAAMTEARAIGERVMAALRSGDRKIRVHYRDGEILSGYHVGGRPAELLAGLGLAEGVENWGMLVSAKLVAALGEEFTFSQAAEFARPALEKQRTARESVNAARAAKFDLARTSGQPVELWSGTDECDGSVPECSWDHITEYALPDGATKIERTHTH